MKTTTKQQLLAAAAGVAVTVGLGAGALTFAQTTPSTSSGQATASLAAAHMPGVGGTVTAVSGNTVTVTGKNGTSYTINAGSATITKDETVAVSAIAVGDTVMANGTLSGTTLTATSLHDGKMPAGGGGFGGRGFGGPQGMGHGVHGTVSAISGNTLTVTSTNPKTSVATTYTVDASSATVLKGTGTTKPATSSLASVAVGDNVMIEGTVSGTSVTAKMVVDAPMPVRTHTAKPATTTTTTQ